LVYEGRCEDMFPEKLVYAKGSHPAALAEVLKGADVFIGVSVANLVTPEMLKSMAADPIVFAMANPDPEIRFETAKATRPDAIVATGRSDFPNQINNVLGFPFIFRGALDVRARKINEEMKLAASHALAALARQPVPAEVCRAYGVDHLEFGRDYILPKPLDKRVVVWEAPAVARAAMQTGVARLALDEGGYRRRLADKFGVE
jgi:malate dehydrogenase (oxaloacetate-decarboxylating)(NADP+)